MNKIKYLLWLVKLAVHPTSNLTRLNEALAHIKNLNDKLSVKGKNKSKNRVKKDN